LAARKAIAAAPADGRVAAVRAFNRFYTREIGVLTEHLLDSPYSLTEARVIFELAQRETTEVGGLRRELGLDAGYLSRMLARLAAAGILTRERSTADGRRQLVRLTAEGRAAFRQLDGRSAVEIARLLDRLREPDRERLVGAMREIRRLLEAQQAAPEVRLRPPGPGDMGWVVQRHGALYAREYGWDESFEALVARIVADYVERRNPEREAAWIAQLDGRPVGCVLCVKREEQVAQLRLLLVEPDARGMGVGSRLVEECLVFAAGAGYREIVLWTNDVLVDARRIYQRAGFELREEESHHSFGHDLVGQYWGRSL
jgi:DNA-binding MarR family transcriptional regulator/N-acetylglutamate synthase-like GNAT family acetyltransferase